MKPNSASKLREERKSNYITSESGQSEWMQQSASHFVFTFVSDKGFTSNLAELHFTSSELETSASPAETKDLEAQSFDPILEGSPKDIQLEPEVDIDSWLALSEESFSFWDNEEDAAYDNL